jgi:import receptor subunit TOM70
MSADAAPLSNAPGPFPVTLPETGTSSLWDRISTWASENKGTVYAIAGITLVVGAGGAIYYLNSNDEASAPGSTSSSKRKKQRERKKAKERAEKDVSKEEVQAGM